VVGWWGLVLLGVGGGGVGERFLKRKKGEHAHKNVVIGNRGKPASGGVKAAQQKNKKKEKTSWRGKWERNEVGTLNRQ